MDTSLLRCPTCNNEGLARSTDAICCEQCNAEYAIIDGVLHIVRQEDEDDPIAAKQIKFYDANTDKYDTNWAIYEPWQLDLRLDFVKLLKAINGNDRMLDAGCGPGRDLRFFRGCGVDAYGLDLSVGQLRNARSKSDAPLFRGSMLSIPFGNGTFDAVWACVSALHIERTRLVEAIAEFRRVLTPDGILFMSFIEGDGTVNIHRSIYDDIEEHIELYFDTEAISALQDAGFEIERFYRRSAFSGKDTSEFTGGSKTYLDFFSRKKSK